MNHVYLVTYNLKSPGKDYSAFFRELKVTGTWCHYIDSTWLIVSTEKPSEAYDRVARHLVKGDRILIIEVTSNYWGFLPKKAWDWVKRNLPTK